jgi:hypothetical protein
MKPMRKAISSGQHTFMPWRCSMVWTKIDAGNSDECVPVSSHARPVEAVVIPVAVIIIGL